MPLHINILAAIRRRKRRNWVDAVNTGSACGLIVSLAALGALELQLVSG